jgi:hypothetical protein
MKLPAKYSCHSLPTSTSAPGNPGLSLLALALSNPNGTGPFWKVQVVNDFGGCGFSKRPL